MFNRKKNSNKKLEEEYEEEIIKNNLSEQTKNVTAKVIRYVRHDEDLIPVILNVCDFHSNILPEKDSIIWAPNEQNTKLEPYKTIRYDFIEDPNMSVNTFIYIVVEPTLMTNVCKISDY